MAQVFKSAVKWNNHHHVWQKFEIMDFSECNTSDPLWSYTYKYILTFVVGRNLAILTQPPFKESLLSQANLPQISEKE